MLRIAVISDTHGRFPEVVREEVARADEIWHLGDFCDLGTLNLVKSLGPPVEAVLGNNDFGLDLPRWLTLERHGKTFRLTHIPPSRPGGADYLLQGHTHVPLDLQEPGLRILNPGSVGKANKGAPASFAWLTWEDGATDPVWSLQILPRGS